MLRGFSAAARICSDLTRTSSEQWCKSGAVCSRDVRYALSVTNATVELIGDIAHSLRFKVKLSGNQRRELDPRVIAAIVAEHLSLLWNFECKPPLAPPSVGLWAR